MICRLDQHKIGRLVERGAHPMRISVEKLRKELGGTLSRTFKPKPEDLADVGIEFANRPIDVSVELQNAGEEIIGTIEVDCVLSLECARCVERGGFVLSAVRQVEYLVSPTPEELEAELDGWFISQYDGETVDLTDDVRQMLHLALPIRFLCRDDCRGLCPHCGKNLNTDRCVCPTKSGEARGDSFRQAMNDILKKKKWT